MDYHEIFAAANKKAAEHWTREDIDAFIESTNTEKPSWHRVMGIALAHLMIARRKCQEKGAIEDVRELTLMIEWFKTRITPDK